MLDVLMSIHQEWIVKMACGDKTDELRKTWPKRLPVPFRVRLYCTQVRGEEVLLLDGKGGVTLGDYQNAEHGWQIGNGLVVGEFICDGRTIVTVPAKENMVTAQMLEISRTACLDLDEIAAYLGRGKVGNAWHVRKFNLYERPIELHRFFSPIPATAGAWAEHLERAPQSWCYIEQFTKGVGA
jgi:hypothetical protein